MHGRSDGRKLRYKGTGHRNVELRAVNRVSPVDGDGACPVTSLASLPICRPHMHAEGRGYLFRVGDDVNLMPQGRQAMRSPVGPHADAALDRRIFAYDADFQRRISTSPAVARSLIRLAASSHSPKVA